MTEYTIYAIEYFRREADAHDIFLRPPAIDPIVLAFYVWAIVGERETIVVDCGFTAGVAERRGRILHREIADAFRLVGVAPEKVETVILTHFHFDHAGCVDLFPKARFYAQRREMAFWSGSHARYPIFRDIIEPADIDRLNELKREGRLTLLEGTTRIKPGVTVHLAGGHTPGMQIVEARTAKGVAVIASDAVKTYRNLAENIPDVYLHDVPGMLDGYQLVRDLAGDRGLIFPGHDPGVLTRFPSPLERVAVLE